MGFKTREEELEGFLAARPPWVQRLLQYDLQLTAEEELAMLRGNWAEDWQNYTAEYERLCQRVPARWREYCKKRKRALGVFAPPAKPGAPRKDALAEEATLLRQSGMSYDQIVDLLNKKYGAGTTTREAVRKLIASRKPRSKPEKT